MHRAAQGLCTPSVVELDRQLMAQWMGKLGFELEIVADYIFSEVKTAERVFADETTLPTLAPGSGSTKTAYLWHMPGLTERLAAAVPRWWLIASKTAAQANARSGTSMVIAASCKWMDMPPNKLARCDRGMVASH